MKRRTLLLSLCSTAASSWSSTAKVTSDSGRLTGRELDYVHTLPPRKGEVLTDIGGFSEDKDPVLSCAWRLIVLDKGPADGPTDASVAAAADCDALDGRLCRQAEERERELFKLIHHRDLAASRTASNCLLGLAMNSMR